MRATPFLRDDEVRRLRRDFGTPLYVYDQNTLEAAAAELLSFPNAFGLTARFAMKALPSAVVLRVLMGAGLHIDASSGYEAERAIRAGVPGERIMLTAQQLPDDLTGLIKRGVRFNACSIHQLRAYGEAFPGSEVSVRINPGLGSGHSNRTNVGGPSSSFGIWHEYVGEVIETASAHHLRITMMHTHIGSGGDPEVWKRCARMSLEIAAKFSEVTRLSLGGGFKVARVDGESSANPIEIGNALLDDFREFERLHGRRLHLELEPGTFLAANTGEIVTTIVDVVDTGAQGYRFIKIDSGMTENLRPSMYGAQHPIRLVTAQNRTATDTSDYVIVGHCCESGDIVTPLPGNPEGLGPRTLPEARIGDSIVIGGAGAYCAAMPAKNYNSYPEAAEVLRTRDGEFKLIRRRQTLDQVLANEIVE